jgi:hypothetical protein
MHRLLSVALATLCGCGLILGIEDPVAPGGGPDARVDGPPDAPPPDAPAGSLLAPCTSDTQCDVSANEACRFGACRTVGCVSSDECGGGQDHCHEGDDGSTMCDTLCDVTATTAGGGSRCPGGYSCRAPRGFSTSDWGAICVPDGGDGLPAGAACAGGDECAPGHLCAGTGGSSFVCTRICLDGSPALCQPGEVCALAGGEPRSHGARLGVCAAPGVVQP